MRGDFRGPRGKAQEDVFPRIATLSDAFLQRWMGHHSPAFTLETFGHLIDGDLGLRSTCVTSSLRGLADSLGIRDEIGRRRFWPTVGAAVTV